GVRAVTIALPDVRRVRVAPPFAPRVELAPRVRQPVVRTVIDGPCDAHRRTLTRLHSAGCLDGPRDRHADLEVEYPRLHREMVREDGARRRHALRAERRHDLRDFGHEDMR